MQAKRRQNVTQITVTDFHAIDSLTASTLTTSLLPVFEYMGGGAGRNRKGSEVKLPTGCPGKFLVAQANFLEIFARCAHRQILNQIWRNPGLGQAKTFTPLAQNPDPWTYAKTLLLRRRRGLGTPPSLRSLAV